MMQKIKIFLSLIFVFTFLHFYAFSQAGKQIEGTVQFVSSDDSYILINLGEGTVEKGDIIDVYKESVAVASYSVKRIFENMSEASILEKSGDVTINIGDTVISSGVKEDVLPAPKPEALTHKERPIAIREPQPAREITERQAPAKPPVSPEEKEKLLADIDELNRKIEILQKEKALLTEKLESAWKKAKPVKKAGEASRERPEKE